MFRGGTGCKWQARTLESAPKVCPAVLVWPARRNFWVGGYGFLACAPAAGPMLDLDAVNQRRKANPLALRRRVEVRRLHWQWV